MKKVLVNNYVDNVATAKLNSYIRNFTEEEIKTLVKEYINGINNVDLLREYANFHVKNIGRISIWKNCITVLPYEWYEYCKYNDGTEGSFGEIIIETKTECIDAIWENFCPQEENPHYTMIEQPHCVMRRNPKKLSELIENRKKAMDRSSHHNIEYYLDILIQLKYHNAIEISDEDGDTRLIFKPNEDNQNWVFSDYDWSSKN